MSKAINRRILRVDLTNRRTEVQEPDEGYYRKFFGGRGFIAQILLSETASGADPFAPESPLIFAAGPENAKQLSSGDDVEARSPRGEPAQDTDIGVGFDGVADQMRGGFESLVENANMTLKRSKAINISGCADFIGNAVKGNFLAVQLADAIIEEMHGAL